MEFDLTDWLKKTTAATESAFDVWVPAAGTRPAVVHEAMRYSLSAGGKRLRPALLFAAGTLFSDSPYEFSRCVPAAVAVECLHTYSLIHDDLPCMDNSDLRRGKPSCHKVFGEAIALLAGDALLTHALTLPAVAYADDPETAAGLVRILGTASGSEHLIGGQVEDILGEKEIMTAERLDFIHQNKTAELIGAALESGVVLADVPAEKREWLREQIRDFGRCVGKAFQIIDDILDETSDAGTMGKPVHADEANQKITYPRLHGMKKAEEEAKICTKRALDVCTAIEEKSGGNAVALRALAEKLLERKF